ncbi:SRPBCC family protein, partial [Coleofasciculus sp.]
MTNNSDWLEHSVQVEVEVPMETVWSLWSDLEQMPRWMKWIDSVQVLEDNPDLSRWKLASSGFEFSWISRILKLVPHQIIQWESVDGLPNRGAVRFYDRHGSSIVKLTVAYDIPGILGKLMDGLFLGRIVESTIQA